MPSFIRLRCPRDSCRKLSSDLDCFSAKTDRIEFIEDNPAIFEALKTFAPAQTEPSGYRTFLDFERDTIVNWKVSNAVRWLLFVLFIIGLLLVELLWAMYLGD